jgi:hypothetical protein
MLAQMAATAGSVAVGSTIGHGLSHMLFGGSSSSTPAEAPQAAAPPVQQYTASQSAMSCEVQAKGKFLLNVLCTRKSLTGACPSIFRVHEVS